MPVLVNSLKKYVDAGFIKMMLYMAFTMFLTVHFCFSQFQKNFCETETFELTFLFSNKNTEI